MRDVGGAERAWREIDPDESYLLARLVGGKAGGFVVRVLHGPRSRFGARYFRLHLEDAERHRSSPVMVGLCNRGFHPSENWIEIASASFTVDLTAGKRHSLDPLGSKAGLELWRAIGGCLPPGGHLMVEYESPEWRETAQGLALSCPPVTTPLGYLMFSIGCGVNFKDWYFSEGLHEGPRKLQGFKELDKEHGTRRLAEMVLETEAFLQAASIATPLLRRARDRAARVLATLKLQRVLDATDTLEVGGRTSY